MANVFGMDMAEMHTLGVKVSELAQQFGGAKKQLDEIVAGLVQSAYTSDDAKAIATAIKSYDPLLRAIQDKLDAFGQFGVASSNRTADTNQAIKDGIANNLNNAG